MNKKDSEHAEELLVSFAESLHDLHPKKHIVKIPITQDAIDQIPLIQFQSVPQVVSSNIHDLEQILLSYSDENLHGDECAIVYRMDTGEYDIVDGDTESVNVKKNSLLLSAKDLVVVIMHNHPNDSNFSIEDRSLFMSKHTIKIMTAVGNNGNVKALERTKRYKRQDSNNYFIQLLRSDAGMSNKEIAALTPDDMERLAPEVRQKIVDDWFRHFFRMRYIALIDNGGIHYEHTWQPVKKTHFKKHWGTVDEGGRR